jgi:hypothetical protein
LNAVRKATSPLLDIAAADDRNDKERRNTVMINNYEVPEVVEMGRAQDVILGSSKLVEIFPDSADQDWRETDMADDE